MTVPIVNQNLRWISKKQWDVVVIGTGMSGATLGYALSRMGMKVLFLEKGRLPLRYDGQTLLGEYPEARVAAEEAVEPFSQNIYARSGRASFGLRDQTKGSPSAYSPFLGEGVGGSSALYGMVMERFHPLDFQPQRRHPEVQSKDLPAQWPLHR